MTFFIWAYDGFDLAYIQDGESHLTGLSFESEKDAWAAFDAFQLFIDGEL